MRWNILHMCVHKTIVDKKKNDAKHIKTSLPWHRMGSGIKLKLYQSHNKKKKIKQIVFAYARLMMTVADSAATGINQSRGPDNQSNGFNLSRALRRPSDLNLNNASTTIMTATARLLYTIIATPETGVMTIL